MELESSWTVIGLFRQLFNPTLFHEPPQNQALELVSSQNFNPPGFDWQEHAAISID